MRALPTAMALVLAALAGCGGGAETSAIPSGGQASASSTTEAKATAPPGCTAASVPKARQDGGQKHPSLKLDPAKTYVATVTTNCGSFAFKLDVDKAPNAAASISYLAARHFFDGTVFHRIAPGFVIQGGDPTGSGSGGPGYKTVDKPPASTKYTKGVVAMAKAGSEKPGTAGSQFFVVTGDASQLTPDYAVVGKVDKGMDVVDRIGKLGDANEQPTATVVIRTMRVRTLE